MPDYSKGKIYTIRCRNDTTLIYVGSTIQPLAKRWGQHKGQYLKTPNYLLYQTINNDWDNWYIELYELYPCNSKDELCKKEGEIIREISNLNHQIAGRTSKEWYEENKEKIKRNREQNKDENKKYSKEWRETNKLHIQKYMENYRRKNKEKTNDYLKNNEAKLKENYNCSCGGCYTFQNKLKHFKTKKHTEFLAKSGGE